MGDKVARQCPQTTTSVEKGEPSEEKGEPKRPIRTEAPPAYQPNALPLDAQTGSHGIQVEMYLSKNAFIAMKQYKNGQKIWREVDECHAQVHSVHSWPVLEYRDLHGIPVESIHAASVTN